MNKEEAFVFLELDKGASPEDVNKRWQEKFNYFQNLHINAPTPQLRDIHARNLEKLKDIKGMLNHGDSTDSTTPLSEDSFKGSASGPEKQRSVPPVDIPQSAIAFLICHTEGKEAKSFSLKEGKNPIGRVLVKGYPSVVIADDQYISRYHAVLTVRRNGNQLAYQIEDNGEFNQGQSSKNGTYVNGSNNRIINTELAEGDTIQIGITKLVLMANTRPVESIVKEVKKTQMVRTVVIDDLL